MKDTSRLIQDANEAVASVAYRLSETIAIYPITPSSPMAELSDEWASQGKANLWNSVPLVEQMQSEGGAAGAMHGALQGGALTTTFTASQGLLLMIPNMYKIAGEMTAFCMHVTARTLATHALSIFGDHSDVMACRQTGFALLCSNSVQEAHDLAAIAHAATLRARIPFLHFFDGFRTSHEVNTFVPLSDSDLRRLIDEGAVTAHRLRGLTPDAPVLRGTAQNPDVFFQAREASNPYYDALPEIVEDVMERFHRLTGRAYHLYEYEGAPDAEEVIVVMGSASETAAETTAFLNQREGPKRGVLKVRLFRPLVVKRFLEALPPTVRRLAVLDRTKEPGAIGEPLYQDVVTALAEGRAQGLVPADFDPVVVGGRYGLGSKEFSPAMVAAVYDHLSTDSPRNHFTVGIVDDVTHTSLPVAEDFLLEPEDGFGAVFYGLGSDGTVGANKNSIKIIGEGTDHYAQAYFVYDSKKSGAMTVSHLRFGPRPIRAPYLIGRAGFIACHQFSFIDRYEVLEAAGEGAVFLLNAPYGPDEIWDRLPREVQQTIIDKQLRLFVIDAYKVARECKMGNRINTIMQTCFFSISGVIPAEQAIAEIKTAIEKTYGKKGPLLVERNFAAVDQAVAHLHEVEVPVQADSQRTMHPWIADEAPDFLQRVTSVILAGKGDRLPVSAFPVDGTWPTATSRWEKRGIAQSVPTWDPDLCIQCGKCSLVCPHAAIRAKAYPEAACSDAPDDFQTMPYKSRDLENFLFTIQTAPEDCTGCQLCVTVCPAKDRSNPSRRAINMTPLEPILERERRNFGYFLDLPETDTTAQRLDVKSSQLKTPLFEFSGACAGCGETPYIKLLTQLFGDRLLIANATGCSSIYGGNLPTTPYAVDANGRGPAWSNSLFEDNAEFGFGLRMANDKHLEMAVELLQQLAPQIGDDLVEELIAHIGDADPAGVRAQRDRVRDLQERIGSGDDPRAVLLRSIMNVLVRRSVWCIGGDGWAYDIGFGGLDHVLSTGRNLNVLVLDTEVYSNTGGQSSKATPMGAIAKFAAAGKGRAKKDLGMIAMGYGNIYVASIAMGAKDNHTVKVLAEAESYDGPSLVIAYSHCIAHGYNLNAGMDQQKKAVQAGYWLLYRYDPRLREQGLPPLQLDSAPPRLALREYMDNEVRFRMLFQSNPARARKLVTEAEKQLQQRYQIYQAMTQSPAKENHDH